MSEVNRRALMTAALSGAALLRARPAGAQSYPQRPVRLIVPYAPGGGTDVFSRLLAAQIEREFGQTFVIDNRPGGASVIGTQVVATAQPDGYIIGMVDSAFVTNPGLLGDKLPYDTRKDFIPVSLLSRTQLVLSVHAMSPFKTAQELIVFAKANPGKLTYASAGIGTGIHLAGEQFRQVTGIDVVIVPFAAARRRLPIFSPARSISPSARFPASASTSWAARRAASASPAGARRNCRISPAWRRSGLGAWIPRARWG